MPWNLSVGTPGECQLPKLPFLSTWFLLLTRSWFTDPKSVLMNFHPCDPLSFPSPLTKHTPFGYGRVGPSHWSKDEPYQLIPKVVDHSIPLSTDCVRVIVNQLRLMGPVMTLGVSVRSMFSMRRDTCPRRCMALSWCLKVWLYGGVAIL